MDAVKAWLSDPVIRAGMIGLACQMPFFIILITAGIRKIKRLQEEEQRRKMDT